MQGFTGQAERSAFMQNKKATVAFYALLMFFSAAAIFWILHTGKSLEGRENAGTTTGVVTADPAHLQENTGFFHQHITGNLPILLLQITVIVLVARVLGFLFRKMGQPGVVGEIFAGLLLGPSLFGLFFPDTFSFIFPLASMGNLNLLSQIGLILFMFVIGMELDPGHIRRQAFDVLVIGQASIVIPYTLGMILSYFLFSQLAPAHVSFLSFSLFMGIAMSVTAFPVLARILQEKKMTGTALGTLALSCAAANDVTAWCILAVLMEIVQSGSFLNALYHSGLVLFYAAAVLWLLRPLLNKAYQAMAASKNLDKTWTGIALLVLLASSYVTEALGIHALFGAFLAGIAMPADLDFRHRIRSKLEDLSVILLLPLYFAYTGLRTQVGLLGNGGLWWVFVAIMVVAVAGKFGGTTLAARITGQNWENSLHLGALMNTRGLMELVVLNIGLDLGILSPEIFTMLILMALVTTSLTGPAILGIRRYFHRGSP